MGELVTPSLTHGESYWLVRGVELLVNPHRSSKNALCYEIILQRGRIHINLVSDAAFSPLPNLCGQRGVSKLYLDGGPSSLGVQKRSQHLETQTVRIITDQDYHSPPPPEAPCPSHPDLISGREWKQQDNQNGMGDGGSWGTLWSQPVDEH